MTTSNLMSNKPDVYASRRKWKNPSSTRTYFSWRSMRSRCVSENHPAWKNYGGRGISVCDKWLNDYDAFFEDMGERPDGKTLERLDVNKGYCPENCVWATHREQGRNKRTNRFLTHNGKTMCLSEWADFLGIGNDTLFRRINVYKMPLEKALSSESLVPQWQHGTRYGYDRGCKCKDCKAAHAARCRRQRQKRKAKALGAEVSK